MPFPFLQRGNLIESARNLSLASYAPRLVLEDLAPGIDNLRHDVFLSAKFCEVARNHIFKLIAKHGGVEELVAEDSFSIGKAARPNARILGVTPSKVKPPDPGEFRRLLAELHTVALNRAKSEMNLSVDLLFRLAVLKFQRAELTNQFNHALERCRARVKGYEGP